LFISPDTVLKEIEWQTAKILYTKAQCLDIITVMNLIVIQVL